MGSKNMKFALMVASALIGLNEAKADIVSPQFRPLEQMSPEQREFVRQQVDSTNPNMNIQWDNVVAGMRDDGVIELRNRITLQLEAIAQPSCFGRQ
jgi:hypothetical protein